MDPTELLKQLGIDLVRDAADLDPIDRAIDFTIYTRDQKGSGLALKAWTEGTGDTEEMLLAGVASSTIKDLHGDTMLPTALIDMEKDAQDNLTIFLNHSYAVPEDVAGSVRQASLTSSVVDEKTGAPIYDLNFERIRIDRTNDRATKSWKSMHGGTKLGLSIGAQIPEGGAVRNKKTGALLIAHVKLLETSIVGIPANPRSWIDAATKAYRSGQQRVWAGIEIPSGSSETATITVEEVTVADSTAPETIVPVDTIVDSTDPSTDTDAPSQDLEASSEPENDGAVATPDVIAAANDVLERTADDAVDPDQARDLLTEAHNALLRTTEALIEADAARADAEQRAEAAETERDAMKANADTVIAEVANLIEQVGKLPAGRQASFKAISEQASSQAIDWESMGFAPEVVRMLSKPSSPER